MTQKERLLNRLELSSIDPITAWSELGIYRLSAVVLLLRQDGYNIRTERTPVCNRYGETCNVANYTLERG